MTLQEWIHTATRGLSPAQQERVALEVNGHLEDAEEHLTGQGVAPDEARRQSLVGLGDPLVASRAFLATFSRPFAWQSLATLAYLILSLPLGIVYFVVLLTGLSVGVALAWTWVGVPILAATFGLVAGFAVLERGLAAGLLGVYVARRPAYSVRGPGFWARARAHLTDKGTWQDVLYLFLKFPLGVLAFVLALTLVTVPLALVAVPFVVMAAPGAGFGGYTYVLPWVDRFTVALEATGGWLSALVGALLLPVSLYLLNLLAAWYGAVARRLLGNGARSVARRIQSPRTGRAAGALALAAGGVVFAVSGPASPFEAPAPVFAGEAAVLERKALELGGVALLEVATGRATVRVRGGQSRSLVQIRRWGGQSYDLQRSGGRLILRENRARNCVGCRAEIEVFLAAEVPLRISNGLGGVAVEGLRAAVEVRNDEGDVALEGLGGLAVVQVHRGDIRLVGARRGARLSTEVGSVYVERLEGDLTARAEAGKLETRHTAGRLDLRTESGDVAVREASGPVQARAEVGAITLERVRLPEGSSNRLQTEAGSLRVAALDAPAGLTLTGQKDAGSLQVNLRGAATEVSESRFSSRVAGPNPARLELITEAGDIAVE